MRTVWEFSASTDTVLLISGWRRERRDVVNIFSDASSCDVNHHLCCSNGTISKNYYYSHQQSFLKTVVFFEVIMKTFLRL